MTEDKRTKISSLEELDKKMQEQRARMKKKAEEQAQPEQVQAPDPQQIYHAPFTEEMEKVFREHISKSIKCQCGWQNFGNVIVLMNTMDIMKEKLPVPTIICTQCGSLFIPKWVRRVINKAIAAENRIMKQVVGARVESDGV
jgi:hypothetical protein